MRRQRGIIIIILLMIFASGKWMPRSFRGSADDEKSEIISENNTTESVTYDNEIKVSEETNESKSIDNGTSKDKISDNKITTDFNEYITAPSFTYDMTAPFDGSRASVIVNDNKPFFQIDKEKKYENFEYYAELDELGRCGVTFACIGKELMPTEERGDIGHVRPSGWHTVKYPDVIEDNYLYNRGHHIAYMLTGKNDDPRNLSTITRFMNIDGMLEYENIVSNYMYQYPDNHVLYRVTAIFNDTELVCRGMLLEAESIETDDVCFCVYCYNNQPGITIDYKTGESEETGEFLEEARKQDYETVVCEDTNDSEYTYVLNKRSKRIHKPDCPSVDDIKDYNIKYTDKTVEELEAEGYKKCGNCFK